MDEVIDLRSDTVTRPSRGMRDAMRNAVVGDDQYGEDPTVNRLQEQTAGLLGKEAALWLPTGTMANQVALRVLTSPGDDVIVNGESHMFWHETGAAAANAGVQHTSLGTKGVFTDGEFAAALKPRDHMVYPPTTLVAIENTHNRAGGVVFPQEEAVRICETAGRNGIARYLNGTRLWNAAAATGRDLSELAGPFNLVSVNLAKGLGAPGGALLAGSRETISRCVRYRRMCGGAMTQVGIFAAAGIYALDHNLNRIVEDHENARLLAEALAESELVAIDLPSVQTNMIMCGLSTDAPNGLAIAHRAAEHGLRFLAIERAIRLVTHLDVNREQCMRAAAILRELIG